MDDDRPSEFPLLMLVPAVTWLVHCAAFVGGTVYMFCLGGLWIIVGFLASFILFPIITILAAGSTAIFRSRGNPMVPNLFAFFVMCCESVAAGWDLSSIEGLICGSAAASLFVSGVIAIALNERWDRWLVVCSRSQGC